MIPPANIQHCDIKEEWAEIATSKARLAYAEKKRGDIPEWTDVARILKEEMDTQCGPTWHCIVGSHFGSFCSYEVHHVLFFSVGEVNIQIYKYG